MRERVVEQGPTVRPAGDRYEREADRIARAAEREPARPPRIQRLPADGGSGGAGAGDPAHPVVGRTIEAARGRGRPIPDPVRTPIEGALGTDLRGVRVHTDDAAHDLNRLLSAQAFTTGSDVFFRRGEYRPESRSGRATLAHELTHVVQQTGAGAGAASPPIQRTFTHNRRNLTDEEADEVAARLRKLTDRKDWYQEFREVKNASRRQSVSDWLKENRFWRVNASDLVGPARRRDDAPAPRTSKKKRKSPPRSKSGEVKTSATTKKLKPKGSPKPQSFAPPKGHTVDLLGNQVRDPTQMEAYARDVWKLSDTPDEKPLSIGAIVWNINHMKAKGRDTTRPKLANDAGKIGELLAQLQGKLAAAESDYWNTAFGFLAQTYGPDLDTKAAAYQAAKAFSGATGRLSDDTLVTTIGGILPALDASTDAPGVRADANRLSMLRRLNYFWEAIHRIDIDLGTATTENDDTNALRDELRNVAASKGIKNLTGQLLKLIRPATLANEITNVKVDAVTNLVSKELIDTASVDAVMLNEMNMGIGELRTAVAARGDEVGLSEGPRMRAKASVDDETGQVDSGQNEFYPAVFDKRSGTSAKGAFYVGTSGNFVVKGQGEFQIGWDKAKDTFRGIVVHRLEKGGREVWAGIIHTTPEGTGLRRAAIWDQIVAPLHNLNALATTFKIPLMVGGDFYIPPEGIVRKVTAAQLNQAKTRSRATQEQILAVKLWNVASNLWWCAERNGLMEHLVPEAKDLDAQYARNRRANRGAYDSARNAFNKAVKPTIDDKVKRTTSTNVSVEAMVEQLAPGFVAILKVQKQYTDAKVRKELHWSSLRAGGDIQEIDIVRNVPVDDVHLTFQREVADKCAMRIVPGGNTTNPKPTGKREDTSQLADLFLVNEHFRTPVGAFPVPGMKQLKALDDELSSGSEVYRKISDHIPQGLLASTTPGDAALPGTIAVPPHAATRAEALNLTALHKFRQRLDETVTPTGPPKPDRRHAHASHQGFATSAAAVPLGRHLASQLDAACEQERAPWDQDTALSAALAQLRDATRRAVEAMAGGTVADRTPALADLHETLIDVAQWSRIVPWNIGTAWFGDPGYGEIPAAVRAELEDPDEALVDDIEVSGFDNAFLDLNIPPTGPVPQGIFGHPLVPALNPVEEYLRRIRESS